MLAARARAHPPLRTTSLELEIPVHPERAIIDATPSGHLTFLVTEFGKPFAVAGFGNRCRSASSNTVHQDRLDYS
jgi:hypothetical protein